MADVHVYIHVPFRARPPHFEIDWAAAEPVRAIMGAAGTEAALNSNLTARGLPTICSIEGEPEIVTLGSNVQIWDAGALSGTQEELSVCWYPQELNRSDCFAQACIPVPITTRPMPCDPETQWVSEVTAFSDEYGGDWSASEVVGEPDIYPSYGDIAGSWTTGSDGFEWLELRFATAVEVGAVVVYETYKLGRLVKVQLLDENGQWDTVWSGGPEDPSSFTAARKFTPTLQHRSYKTRQVRLEADFTNGEYYEIDAVLLVSSCSTTAMT